MDAHLGICASCREDLAAQQRLCAAIEAQPALDYMPVASLKRLQARLDAQAERGAGAARPPQERESSEPLAVARLDGSLRLPLMAVCSLYWLPIAGCCWKRA